MSGTFKVVDLSPFNVGDELDSRMNHPKEGGNDINMTKLQDGDRLNGEDNTIKVKAKDPLSLPQKPIIRSRERSFKRP